MASAWSRWVRALGAAALLAGGAVGLGACTTEPVPIVVAGLDRQGTPVVGALDCTYSTEEFDRISVSTDESLYGIETWAIHRPFSSSSGGSFGTPSGPLQPPDPDPRSLDRVELIAVGDPSVPGWVTDRTLDEPLPELGTMDVSFDHDDGPAISLSVALDGPPDRYAASIDGDVVRGVGTAELQERIAEVCDEAQAFSGGTFAAISGGTTVVVAGLAVVIGVATRRQWRRTTEAIAARTAAITTGPG
jgi:hypothetical protein